MSEERKIEYKIEDGKFVVAADLDKDGKPMIELKLDLKEVMEAIVAAVVK